MARYRQNKSSNQRSGRNHRSGLEEGLFEQSSDQTTPEIRISAESVELSSHIRDTINQKVQSLVGGLTGLKQFYLSKDENEGFANFFEENKEPIESLLKYDLNRTYNDLVKNDTERQRLYRELTKQGIISNTELSHLLGVVAQQPYTNYIQSLTPRNQQNNPDLTALTEDDRDNLTLANTDNIQIIVDRLQSEHKITAEEGRKLIELGPKTDQQIIEARNTIFAKIKGFDLANHTQFYPQYLQTLKNEDQLETEIDAYIEQYDHLVEGLVKQLSETQEADQNQQFREQRLKQLARETGLPIRPGQILWGFDLENSATGTKVKDQQVEITGISSGEEESDPEILPEFRKRIPTLEPVIEFTITTPDGQGSSHKLSATTFQQWSARNQLSQKFEDLEALEEDLGVSGLLSPGKIIEYLEPKKGATIDGEAYSIKTTQIEKIENGLITLDRMVILDQGGPGRGISSPRFIKEMDFGEFARWYKKTQAVPEFANLDEVDQALEKHHQQLYREMGWPAGQGQPIKLDNFSEPIHLISAYDPDLPLLTIEKIDQDGLHFQGGDLLKPQQFYRIVREHGITRPTAEQLAELKRIAEAKNDQDKLQKLTEISPDAAEKPTVTKAPATSAPQQKVPGYWKSLWENATFLNLMEMYELFVKAPSDRVKAWLKDRSERRVAKVGKEFYKGFPKFGGLNDLSDSYEGTWNAKNSGDVKELMEWFDNNYYLADIVEAMYQTAEKPTYSEAKINFKAAIQLVTKKGVVRWEDDEQLWAAVNRLNAEGKFKYPDKFKEKLGNRIVVIGDPEALEIDPTLSIFDQYRIILDGVYGAGSFDSWSGQNEREYRTQREEAQGNMHKYEFLQGGIGRQLQKMVYDWEHDRPVNPAEFDGLLAGAIQGMEVSIEQGMLLLVAAFAVKNKKGQTLLPFSRLNPFVKDLRNHQLFFYFAVGHELLDERGNPIMETDPEGNLKPKKGKFSLNNFQHLFTQVMAQDIESNGRSDLSKYEAGKNTINWIQSEVLTNSLVKNQSANKAGSADIAPGAYHYLGPLVWEEDNLDKIIGKSWGSSPKPEIAKNMYVGYNNQLIIRANRLNKGKNTEDNLARAAELGQMVFSFLYFNHSVKGKINYNQPFLRLSEVQFNDRPIVDKKRRVQEFSDETENFIKVLARGVAKLSKDSTLSQMVNDILFNPAPHLNEEEESKFRNKLNLAISELAKTHPAELAALAKQAAIEMKGTSGAQLSHEEKQQLKEGT